MYPPAVAAGTSQLTGISIYLLTHRRKKGASEENGSSLSDNMNGLINLLKSSVQP